MKWKEVERREKVNGSIVVVRGVEKGGWKRKRERWEVYIGEVKEKFAFWLSILALPSHVVIKNAVNRTYHPKDRIYQIYRLYNFIRWILHEIKLRSTY